MSEENKLENTDTSNNAPQEENLDSFAEELFTGKAPEQPVDDNDDSDGADEGDTTSEGETSDGIEDTTEVLDDASDDSDDDDGDDGEADQKPKEQKKSRAQERIEELNAKYREEERKRQLLEERLSLLEQSSKPKTDEDTPAQQPQSEDGPKAPHWDDVNEKGEKKYKLGQFDPQFNADLVRFTVREEQRQLEEQRQQTEQQRQVQMREQQRQQDWEEKLNPARERYPDFQEKGQELVNSFDNLDQGYAKYLTDTIQSMDNGPDVLYHLASNPELAHQIVNRGPAMASVELGKLSAQFGGQDTNSAPTKVTKAPPPPPTARGSAPPKSKDMDNLDHFEKMLFKK